MSQNDDGQRGLPPDAGAEELDTLQAGVAAVLRAAKESAAEIVADAEEIRRRAVEVAETLRAEAASEAAALRAEAQTVVDEARAKADQLVRDMVERVQAMEAETEARLRNRLGEIRHHENALRGRLQEANNELQLALLVVGEPSDESAEDDVPEPVSQHALS